MKQRGSTTLHYLDRYLGIPAVAVLGGLRRQRRLPEKINSIGLLKLAAIGDTVLISAVAADIRAAFPTASMTFFAGSTNCELVQMLDSVDRVVEVPIHNIAAALCAVRSVPVDVMIDFGSWPRLEALLTLFSRASFTIGFETPRQFRHYGYDSTVHHSSKIHELENLRNLIVPLSIRTRNLPQINVPNDVPSSSGPWAVCHLWPGGRRRLDKQWPIERWVRLINEIASWELDVVLTGGPGDYFANEAVLDRIGSCARRKVRNLAGITLKETAAILAGSSFTVSVDTGVMHMAAALGAPVVVLHGPSSSKRWGPLSRNAVCIDSPHPRCGYISLGWERGPKGLPCMQCISYESVRDACRKALAPQAVEQFSFH